MANNIMAQTIKQYIESKQTPNGGYTKATLAQFGVAWPPKKGWKEELIKAQTQNPTINT